MLCPHVERRSVSVSEAEQSATFVECLGVGRTSQRVEETHRRLPKPAGRVILDAHEPIEATPPRVRRRTESPAAAIKAAINLLLEEVPHLRSLIVAVDDDGEPDVSFEVASIVSGTVTL